MSDPSPCEYISWSRFYASCRSLAGKIRAGGFAPQLIVAIGRGGWMPGRILSDLLGQMNVASFKIEHYRGTHQARVATVRYPLSADVGGQRVLVVDDVTDSGDTFEVALSHIRARGAPSEIRTAVLHHKTASQYAPDFYAHKVIKWRWIIYPWAAIEDLSSFLEAMDPPPDTVDDFAARLIRDHRLQVPRRVLDDVFTATRHRAWT
jgi:hypoxanthine phosphoribosyltransferase